MLYKKATELAPEALAKLCIAAYNRSVAHALTFKPEEFPKWCLENSISLPHSLVFFLPKHPIHPVGLALISEDLSGEPKSARLKVFGVVPCFRGDGIAEAGLEELTRGLRGRGVGLLEVGVLQENGPAVKRFRKSGFEIVGESEESGKKQYDMVFKPDDED